MEVSKYVYDLLLSVLNNPYAVCGVMGNLQAESGMRTNNVQNSFESVVGSDDVYTESVNSGSISKQMFMRDGAGYGLAQWTFWSRKKMLYEYTVEKGLSIDSVVGQVSFLIDELKSYGLIDKLSKVTSIREASDIILKQYERPKDQSESACVKRAKLGESFYEKYSAGKIDSLTEAKEIASALRDMLDAFLKTSYN